MPGTEIALVEQAASRSIPTDTGVGFFVGAGGPAASGVAGPTKLVNTEQFTAIYGARVAENALLADAVEVFFREGGSELYVSASVDGTDANVVSALDQFNKELGPGQVAAPGITSDAVYTALLAHAAANHRVALLDGANDADPAVVQAAHDAIQGDANNRFGAFFGNWLIIPGLVAGTTRVTPPSAHVAGLIARSDRGGNPNVPAAGSNGVSNVAIDVAESFLTADADALNDGSVNVFRTVYGNVELYGFRTLVRKDTDPQWWQFSAARLYMAIAARSEVPLQAAVFAQIDGGRTRLAQLEGELTGVLLGLLNEGALYGGSPTEAFSVDATSQGTNPDAQIATGTVRAVVNVRMSPFAEVVRMELSKTAITDNLPA